MRDLKIYIAVTSLLLLLYLLAQFHKPKEISWAETLKDNDKIPFGTYILYNRLNDIFPGATIKTYRWVVNGVINNDSTQNASYIIVCDRFNTTDDDYDALMKFTNSGNEVFVSAEFFYGALPKKLHFMVRNDFNPDWFNLRFVNKALDTNKLYTIQKEISNSYFANLDTAKATVLSETSDRKATFVRYKIGKGALYLCSTPIMFSNFSLLDNQGAAYASIALSHLTKCKNVIWDEYYTQGAEAEGSVFRVFLNNQALQWALYLACVSLLVFVVYELKRRQRIIPVITPLPNTTVDFVKVVGQVYYEKRDNSNIAKKMVVYFLEYLRSAYNLKTNQLDQEFIDLASHKSGADALLIKTIVNMAIGLQADAKVNDADLITLNRNIQEFYNQAR